MIIPPDRSYNYPIPHLEGSYVRTGVSGQDQACFFHSYLRAFNFKYRHMGPSERIEAVRMLRDNLAAAVSLESFRATANGEQRRLFFFGALRQLLERQNIVLPSDELIKILQKATTYKDNFYMTFVKEALETKTLADAPISTQQSFVDNIKYVFQKANELSIETFRHELSTAEVSEPMIEFIARYLRCNFLFLYETQNGVERYPFTCIVNEDWPFCVMLWIQKCHYEIIGKKEPHGVINRVFYRDDEIVIKFLINDKHEEVES